MNAAGAAILRNGQREAGLQIQAEAAEQARWSGPAIGGGARRRSDSAAPPA